MLKIRLQRIGRSNSPAYRVVVAEHTAASKGKFLEIVGNYIPAKNNQRLELKTDRINYWFSVGAEPSQTVARLALKQGVKTAEKFIKTRIMKPSKAERAAAEAKQKDAEETKAKAIVEQKAAAEKSSTKTQPEQQTA